MSSSSMSRTAEEPAPLGERKASTRTSSRSLVDQKSTWTVARVSPLSTTLSFEAFSPLVRTVESRTCETSALTVARRTSARHAHARILAFILIEVPSQLYKSFVFYYL